MNGEQAEAQAAEFLLGQGLALLEKNYRCRAGEIDLVMREGSTVVFVEVRLRASDRYGGAIGSITGAKKARLLRAAKHYLAGRKSLPPCRFDVVLFSGTGEPHPQWIKDAFGE